MLSATVDDVDAAQFPSRKGANEPFEFGLGFRGREHVEIDVCPGPNTAVVEEVPVLVQNATATPRGAAGILGAKLWPASAQCSGPVDALVYVRTRSAATVREQLSHYW